MFTYLKRRFSSGDLQGEAADQREQEGLPSFLNFNSGPSTNSSSHPPTSASQGPPTGGMSGVSSNQQPPPVRKGPYPSAPTSPSKTFNPVGSITGQISSTITRGIFSSNKPTYNKERCKVLLVIDEPHTDWSKYFRGKKIFGDWDIRVEQAQFKEISLAAYTDQGVIVDVQADRSGTRVVKSFRPDFVLIRQHPCDAGENWRSIVLGLMYGGVHSVNSLHAIYNFLDRPWVFAHLIHIQNRLGRDVFPLIEQSFFPCHKDMMLPYRKENRDEGILNFFRSSSEEERPILVPKLPAVVKVGNTFGGKGKIRVENQHDMQDIASLVAVAGSFATAEPFVDSKFDLHIQKIGNNCRAYIRKSISGTWKANIGSAVLEQINLTDRFKLWIEEVSKLFGGLDICSIEALQGKDGQIYIYQVTGSDLNLLGETQEEDRRIIAEVVLHRMQMFCKPVMTKTPSLMGMNRMSSDAADGSAPKMPPQQGHPQPPPPSGMHPGPPPQGMPGSGPGQRPHHMGPGPQGPPQPGQGVPPHGPHAPHAPPPGQGGPGPMGPRGQPGAPHPQGPMGMGPPPGSQGPPPSARPPGSSGGGSVSGGGPMPPPGASIGLNQTSGSTPPPMAGQMSRTDPRDVVNSAIMRLNTEKLDWMSGSRSSVSSGGSPSSKPPSESGSAPPGRPPMPNRQTSLRSQPSLTQEDADDTMKNLRKTFAGIFGDM